MGQLNNYYGQGANALQTNYAAGLQPFQTNFNQAQQGTTQLGNLLGQNGPAGSQQAMQTLQATPGYQFQLQQGDNAVNANAAATGGLGSGKQETDLSQFNQGLAGTTYNQAVQNLQPYLGAAGNAATGIGALNSGLGNQLSNLYQSQGNAGYAGNTSIGNAQANADMAGLTASGNLWGLGLAGLTDATKLAGMSDARVKEDIEPVGELYDGQQIYRYRYIDGDPRTHIGLLAQEVQEVEPNAVRPITPEYLGVDYKAATNYAADLARFSEV